MNKQLITFVALVAINSGVQSSVDAQNLARSSSVNLDADSALTADEQSLRALVDYAVAHNSDVNAARQRHLGALARVPQATALPEPKLTYRYFVDEVETRVGPQEHGIGLSQTLPWFGKRSLQGAAATEAARASAERVASIQNAVIADVASAWYELFYLGQTIEIVRGNRDLVLHLEQVARARYGTGAATHADVIRAQVELATIENRLASLRDRRAPLFARMNALINRPTTEMFTLPKALTRAVVDYTDEELLEKVTLNNPELRATSFDIEAAYRQRDRANKNYLPDVTLGVDYIATGDARMSGVNGSGDDALSATIGFTLPIWRSKYDAGVKEADAMLAQHQFKRDQQLNTFHAQTVTALFKLRDAERQINLYENTLLPKANESLVATQRAYSAGAAPFSDMIDAQRMLLSFELSFARAITDHNQARIILEKLTGEPLIEQTLIISQVEVSS
ncbi:MAG: TolC family protein [Pseudomonadales bacterium]|nr:TolC family protein [Pseudomonadales bacterium]